MCVILILKVPWEGLSALFHPVSESVCISAFAVKKGRRWSLAHHPSPDVVSEVGVVLPFRMWYR